MSWLTMLYETYNNVVELLMAPCLLPIRPKMLMWK